MTLRGESAAGESITPSAAALPRGRFPTRAGPAQVVEARGRSRQRERGRPPAPAAAGAPYNAGMLDARALQATIRDAVLEAPSADAAMARAVDLLARGCPHFTWTGIYLLEGDELVLGPFVGKPSPHTRIPLGRGICGAAATERATIVVDDVNADPRYLACSLETRSEIVVPIMAGARVLGEIDIDSDQPAAFGPRDRTLLEAVAEALARRLDARGSVS